jgi:hypothetical protein
MVTTAIMIEYAIEAGLSVLLQYELTSVIEFITLHSQKRVKNNPSQPESNPRVRAVLPSAEKVLMDICCTAKRVPSTLAFQN